MLAFLAACTMAVGQTSKVARHKAATIYSLKQIRVGYSVKKHRDSVVRNTPVLATDSILRMLPRDAWFSSLSDSSKHYRIVRIEFYDGLCKRKPSQSKFLPGWVDRALIPRKPIKTP